MRLINYGPGEIADRLTILSLKILHGGDAGKDVGHFVQERNALLAQLRGRETTGAWFEFVVDLGAVNGALWQAEDDLRNRRSEESGAHSIGWFQTITELAFHIQSLNDRRAVLVQQINEKTGDFVGQEKL